MFQSRQPSGQTLSADRDTRTLGGTVLLVALAFLSTLSCAEPQVSEIRGMFRGGPLHQGVYAGGPDAGYGQVEWAFRTGGPVRGSAVLDGDLLFVGSGDGTFYAIEAASGEERWRFPAGSPIRSTPAVYGDYVVFGDRLNKFYALDRDGGRLIWQADTGADHEWEWGREGWDYFTSSPAMVDGLVVVGSGDGNVYAFDAGNGAEAWQVSTGGRVRSSPAVSEGVVYVGSADGFLYAIELESGSLRWKFETQGVANQSSEFGFDRKTIQSSPAVADGVVYFGSRDGGVYAVDAVTGERRWYHDYTTPWVVSSPAVQGGALYTTTSDGLFVNSLDTQTSEERWRFQTRARVFSSPALAGGVLYVGTHGRRLLALDAEVGELLWDLRFDGIIMSSPLIDGDHIYVGCDDGFVYAIRLVPGSAPRRAVYWDGDRVGRSTLQAHEDVRDYFEAYGYQVVDRFQLADLMRSSIERKAPSVVVFAMDDLPGSVAPVAADTVLARRYLDAGGKIVWLGLPPLLLQWSAEGGITGVSREAPGQLLGVDHDRYDFDQYAVYPTPTGVAWGLTDWYTGFTGVDTAGVSVVLAKDENGGAAAWVKSYGGLPGSGFVSLRGPYRGSGTDYYGQLRSVAEWGIGSVPEGGT